MSDKEILDHLLNIQHYDKREKPPSSGKEKAILEFLSYLKPTLSKIQFPHAGSLQWISINGFKVPEYLNMLEP